MWCALECGSLLPPLAAQVCFAVRFHRFIPPSLLRCGGGAQQAALKARREQAPALQEKETGRPKWDAPRGTSWAVQSPSAAFSARQQPSMRQPGSKGTVLRSAASLGETPARGRRYKSRAAAGGAAILALVAGAVGHHEHAAVRADLRRIGLHAAGGCPDGGKQRRGHRRLAAGVRGFRVAQ